MAILGDAYDEIRARRSQSWRHCNVQFPWLCGHRPSPTMGIFCYRQRYLGHVAPSVYPLIIMWSIDGRLPCYGHIHIRVHAASCLCCFRLKRCFVNVRPGSCFRWLHRQLWGGLTAVCIVAVSLEVTHFKKRPSFRSIRIYCHLSELCV